MRGQGRVYRPKARGRATTVWWFDYADPTAKGGRRRESSGTRKKREALRLLRKRQDEREAGRLIADPRKVTLAHLKELVERQYALDGRRSLKRVQGAFAHLEDSFGTNVPVPTITTPRLDAYAEQRLAKGRARATVNYELAVLRRGFRLAIEKGLLATMPSIKLPRVRNARSGFFEPGNIKKLLVAMPGYLRPLVRFLYLTGWRRGEALGLLWSDVDRDGRVIRLAEQSTKAGEPRLFPYGEAPELQKLLDAQWAARDGLFVFHRKGGRIGVMALRKHWDRACQRVGLAGRLVHDLRRTAARELRRAGVSEGEIMRLCGWRTRSMFDRYNIIDEQDLARAVARRFANGKQTANTPPAEQSGDPLSSSATT